MTLRFFPFVIGALALATQLVACDSHVVRQEAPLRMVKLITAGATISGEYRFVGLVRQAQRADLSFENGGRLVSMGVDVGDTVRKGQVLAMLDSEPARLQVLQAAAQLRSSAGQLQERREQLRQQEAMHADGATSRLTLNAALTALTAAEAAHSSAAAALQLAERAQRQCVLRAPYTGRIKARLAEPGALATGGQSVLQIEGDGHTQVVADLPAALLPPSLKMGAVVVAQPNGLYPMVPTDHTVGTTGDETSVMPIKLVLRSLADHVDTGGTVQAIFDLPTGQAQRRSGEALSITIASGAPQTLTLPLTAVAQGTVSGTGHVFVYHRPSNLLEQRAVMLGRQRGNDIEITQGLGATEQVVGAGTAFLIDRQRVSPYRSESALAAGEQQ